MTSPLARFLNLTRPLHNLDFETTGIDPRTARICSIGLRSHLPDGTVDEARTLVNPDILMPKKAEETHKITDDIIRHGCAKCWRTKEEHNDDKCERWRPVLKFADLAARFYQRLQDSDYMGYNVRYDLQVAAAEFGRLGLEFDYSKACIIDSHRIESILEPRDLSAVYKRRTGKELEGAHDALTDVLAAEEVFIAQYEHPNAHVLPRSVAELHNLLWPRDPNSVDSENKFLFAEDGLLIFGFGKHKGRPVLRNLGYVQWMVDSGTFSPEVRRVCEAILAGKPPRRV